MKFGRRVAVAVFLLAAVPFPNWAGEEKAPVPTAPSATAPKPPVAEDLETGYRIGPGDLLNVEVLRDKELTRPLIVLPDGKIAYPLIGELVAEGKTISQLRKEIEGKLAQYLKDAVVTVEVRQMNSLHIYLLGRVNAPGRYVLSANVTVLQALAIAGGPNAFANRNQIRIFREKEGKTTRSPTFDYDEVTAGKNMETNILLQRGDVVFVP